MGFTSRPPTQESTIFNPSYYASATDILSLEMADSLYLSKTDYRLSYISGITMGQASPLSALVTDANRNIADIGELSCTSLKLNGSTVNLSKLDLLSATPGTASSGKALITDGLTT
ncbi:hypothetical protein AM588_10000440 [Phytophthora nicotianae]|uniref:Uncharacterized protein n=1 Tax=Phytophthora nicotianae TaxID=4792 RepID=A0A0W8CFC6_PHYNI|nr:hypothetical protein AM588_10000440 [Phytophthora nicotianae]